MRGGQRSDVLCASGSRRKIVSGSVGIATIPNISAAGAERSGPLSKLVDDVPRANINGSGRPASSASFGQSTRIGMSNLFDAEDL